MRTFLLLGSLALAMKCVSKSSSRPKTYLLFGPSGSGKSTFCNAVKGSHAKDGCSSTSTPRTVGLLRDDLLDGQPIVLIDTPGYDKGIDTSLKLRSFLKKHKSSHSSQIHEIILFESLRSETITLENSIRQAKELFLKNASPPMLLLMTYADIRTYERCQEVYKLASSLGIPAIIWNNNDVIWNVDGEEIVFELSAFHLAHQLQELNENLDLF